MKQRITLLLLALTTTLTLAAQTVKVYTGKVITLIPCATAGDITFADQGATLNIMGSTFATSDIDQIVVDDTTVPTATLSVSYADNDTWVTVSGDVAPNLTITTHGDHVSVVADSNLKTEVTYTLSGTATNGSFYMDGHYKSTLTLNNLTLTNPDSAAICIDNGKRIAINLPTGTTTTLTDGTGTQKACFFVNGHAEFAGGGTLLLTGNAKHAYASDEYTTLGADFGTLTVQSAANDGLHVEQYFEMNGGTVSIASCAGDCIDVSATKDSTDANNGQVFVNGGTLNLDIAAEDVKGLKSENDMTISGGQITANVAGNGSKGISVGGNLIVQATTTTSPVITMTVSGTTYHKGLEDESKCRGIKVKGNYTLAGGTISMTVTGKKAKGISIDGTYTYTGGKTNVEPE